MPKPEIGENDILIQIVSTALNRADIMMREGRYPNQKQDFCFVLSGKIYSVKCMCNIFGLT